LAAPVTLSEVPTARVCQNLVAETLIFNFPIG
jgi:hypothetical protein